MSTRTPCVGKHVLFDSTDPEDHELAARFCATCPLVDACTKRLEDLIADASVYSHPGGTWAGRLVIDGNPRNEVRRLARESRTQRIEDEDARYSDDEMRQAHAAYTGGDKSEWARTGHRVYDRRRKQRQRDVMAVAS